MPAIQDLWNASRCAVAYTAGGLGMRWGYRTAAKPFERGALLQSNSLRHGFKVPGGIAKIQPGRLNALMEQVQGVFFAVANGSHDLMAFAGDPETGFVGIGFCHSHCGTTLLAF